jgi:glycosyltransferase involved in cell wall biosynthesis
VVVRKAGTADDGRERTAVTAKAEVLSRPVESHADQAELLQTISYPLDSDRVGSKWEPDAPHPQVVPARSAEMPRAEDLWKAHKRIAELTRELDVRNREVEVMRQSKSWRLTQPLRDISAQLGDFRGWLLTLSPRARVLARTTPGPASAAVAVDGAWPKYATDEEAESVAAMIRNSKLFDAQQYTARLGRNNEVDPALHYVLIGEQMGLMPSNGFDPMYYRDRYPDLAESPMNALAHYLSFGQAEGRRAVSVASELYLDRSRIDPRRKTILLVAHDASRSGAPILAHNLAQRNRPKYNVVALLLGGGELLPHFEETCAAVVGPNYYDPIEMKYLIRRLSQSYGIEFAIVNSIESRVVLPSLAYSFVPTVALVHEFAAYTRPRGEMGRALDWSTEVVFSADIVASAARTEHPTLSGRPVHVLPQGQTDVPGALPGARTNPTAENLDRVFRPKGAENSLVVLGCGTVQFRKGIDLFLACASAVVALSPRRPVRFVWIGHGYDPEKDPTYSCFLADQIKRAGLEGTVVMFGATSDPKAAYTLADVFFLSSRLDPLPNAAMDAALRGIPVVCFEGTTGLAEIQSGDPIARQCVVPYLDVAAAARIIVGFANDEEARKDVGAATCQHARSVFSMERYVARIDELGQRAAQIMRQRAQDFDTIRADPFFDAHVYTPPDQPPVSRDEAIAGFLARWTAVGMSRQAASNPSFRRPGAGFHPQLYAERYANRYDNAVVNPLADFIRNGKPAGPWCSELITPMTSSKGPRGRFALRVALHAHFYYPDLVDDFMRRMASNQAACDLLLSTDTDAKARSLRRSTVRYDRGGMRISVVPNRGRDIGPLLTELADDVNEQYDLIGHIHSKRSLMVDPTLGDRWREFLWENLLGDQHSMMDMILERFAANDKLGLVFAADPHLCDWDGNYQMATELATRMGISEPLPPFFDFPIGTMFWARRQALKPLFDLKLGWDDYPEEPVPGDGTILHALERLLPFAARQAGYRFATTHVPGITW